LNKKLSELLFPIVLSIICTPNFHIECFNTKQVLMMTSLNWSYQSIQEHLFFENKYAVCINDILIYLNKVIKTGTTHHDKLHGQSHAEHIIFPLVGKAATVNNSNCIKNLHKYRNKILTPMLSTHGYLNLKSPNHCFHSSHRHRH
jgi:hypothetical protein